MGGKVKCFEIDVGVLYGILFYFWRLWGKIVASSATMTKLVIETMTGFIGVGMTGRVRLWRGAEGSHPVKFATCGSKSLATVQVATGGRGIPSLGTADGKWKLR